MRHLGSRARTRPGRLLATQQYLAQHESQLLSPGSTVVDFGFGQTPVTTVEWADALDPRIAVVAIEHNATHVETARRLAPQLAIVHGGFETLATLGPVTVVRAMNVLRGYRAEDLAGATEALAAPLIDGGLLLEGSTDTAGDVMVASLLRKGQHALTLEGLLFHTTFARGFAPWLFRDSLPRAFRRSTRPGTPLYAFLEAWQRAFAKTQGPLSERFDASIAQLPGATRWADGGLRWSATELHFEPSRPHPL